MKVHLNPQLRFRIRKLLKKFRREGNPSIPIDEADILEAALFMSLDDIEKLSFEEFEKELVRYRGRFFFELEEKSSDSSN